MGFIYSLTDTEWTRPRAWALAVAFQWTYGSETLSTREYYEALGYFDDQTSLIRQMMAVWNQSLTRKLWNPVKPFEFWMCFFYVSIDHISLWCISDETREKGYLDLISFQMLGRLIFRLIALTFKLGYGLLQCITSPINRLYRPFIQYFQRMEGHFDLTHIPDPFNSFDPSLHPFNSLSFIVWALLTTIAIIFVFGSVATGGLLPGVAVLGTLSASLASPVSFFASITGSIVLAKVISLIASLIIVPVIIQRFCQEFIPFLKDLASIFKPSISNHLNNHPGYDYNVEMQEFVSCDGVHLWQEKECLSHQLCQHPMAPEDGWTQLDGDDVFYKNASNEQKIACLSHPSCEAIHWSHSTGGTHSGPHRYNHNPHEKDKQDTNYFKRGAERHRLFGVNVFEHYDYDEKDIIVNKNTERNRLIATLNNKV